MGVHLYLRRFDTGAMTAQSFWSRHPKKASVRRTDGATLRFPRLNKWEMDRFYHYYRSLLHQIQIKMLCLYYYTLYYQVKRVLLVSFVSNVYYFFWK